MTAWQDGLLVDGAHVRYYHEGLYNIIYREGLNDIICARRTRSDFNGEQAIPTGRASYYHNAFGEGARVTMVTIVGAHVTRGRRRNFSSSIRQRRIKSFRTIEIIASTKYSRIYT